MSDPQIAILIPVFNEEPVIRGTVKALLSADAEQALLQGAKMIALHDKLKTHTRKEFHMKKTLFTLAAVSLVASAFATGSPPPVTAVTVTGSGSNSVLSSTSSGSYVLGSGSSISRAANTQTATAYVGGSGSYSSRPSNAFVSVEDCAPTVKVSGTQTNGSVLSFGGTSATGQSSASNVSTGTGTGGAQAAGFSLAEVTGSTMLHAPGMTLNADGSAFSAVGTNTGVVGTNGSATSGGATSSAYRSTSSGSLFTYSTNGLAGDIKSVTSNTYTRVGGIPTVTSNNCGASTCVTGPSTTTGVNAVVEGGAVANAGGEVKATITVTP